MLCLKQDIGRLRQGSSKREEALALMQALHINWLPRITTEILASLGRCPHGAVSPDREVLQRTTFVREEQYLTFVKVEFEVLGSDSAEHMRVESKVKSRKKKKSSLSSTMGEKVSGLLRSRNKSKWLLYEHRGTLTETWFELEKNSFQNNVNSLGLQ